MASVFVVIVGFFGALIGSFLNVVIYRVPAKKSIVSPPSACGSCGARIRPWDNIPVVSWFILRGRCRDCGAHISARYPAVELGTALFFAAVAWWVAATVTLPLQTPDLLALILLAVAFLYLASISVALALIDLDTHTLPNAIVLPAYLVGGALLAASALLAGEPGRLLSAAIGGGGLFALYLALALVRPGGMGLGDVKLAGVLGLYLGWLGWGALFVGAFGAFLLGGVFGLLLMASRKAGRKSSIPFGPWMLLGAWLGIFAGDQLATGYLALFGLA
ncbi:prepilin peptidase [Cryobacterium sp. TMT1-3]|uniref:Prepilin leader peptidase/N-methyltransferase n=1 Tax=Cryobacterium luteum TaxID=1424661 RepID=A0A1H8C0T0_9MICO|nr:MULTISPECIES: A24 family peptidase [Cryobacterium]TFB89207.1 prepilin peptidase [Cryobacterium luteum]TFC27482.1 prepilin peptidase [Cryobacterium sp. TMT1-3]SEM88680.1 leader peptidase (prepilin peptidase) / N-methyltransferase [Cryobacterium luteum]